MGVFWNLWKESFWFLFFYILQCALKIKSNFPFEKNVKANLHYFHKLKGTQNEENESVKCYSFSSHLPALSYEDFLQ